jgi:hypothetical protein
MIVEARPRKPCPRLLAFEAHDLECLVVFNDTYADTVTSDAIMDMNGGTD